MTNAPRIVSNASEMSEPERFCTCCEARLSGKVAWLELDQRDGTYHDFGDVPTEKSQGWFPFGMGCARRLKTEAEHKRETTPCPA